MKILNAIILKETRLNFERIKIQISILMYKIKLTLVKIGQITPTKNLKKTETKIEERERR